MKGDILVWKTDMTHFFFWEEIEGQRNEGLARGPSAVLWQKQANFSVSWFPIHFKNGFNLFMDVPGDESLDIQEKTNSYYERAFEVSSSL